ncbi:MAG: 3'-5' exonuclease [Anaerolineae bacterium]
MSYEILHKPAFLENLLTLNRNTQKQVVQAIRILQEDPRNTASKNIERLKNWDRLWSYRVNDGDRILYAVHGNTFVQLLDVGSHDYIYNKAAPGIDQYDNLDGLQFDPATIEDVLDPTSPTTPAHVPNYPRQRRVTPSERPSGELIPMAITEEMLRHLNVPTSYHAALMAARTADDLLEACAGNERLFESLYDRLYNQPSLADIAQQPNYILANPEDLLRYTDGDLLAFLLWLDPEQKQLVDFNLSGPTLIKGGPGSGKSTVALYRIQALLEQAQPSLLDEETPRILFTTYTNALIRASEQLLEQLLTTVPDTVTISTVDRMAMTIVRQVEGRKIEMAGGQDWAGAFSHARAVFKSAGGDALAARMLNPYESRFTERYLQDEIEWIIDGQGLATLEDYLAVQRHGRSTPFNPEQRRAVWQIYEKVKEYFAANYRVTWGDLRQKALAYVRSGEYADRYDYVLVDEAQDLTPVQIQLCLALCKRPAGLFLTADQSQSIYNAGFSWQRVHEDLKLRGRTRHLKRNYRTTLEIAVAAHQFLNPTRAGDPETLTQEYVHRGNPPVVYAAESEQDQIDWLCDALHRAARSLNKGLEAVAVLVPSKDLGYRLQGEFTARQVPAMFVTGREDFDLRVNSIKIMTMHAAKGLEFPVVALPYVEDGVIPRDIERGAPDYEEKLNTQRRLFYVAATRAMQYLFVTYTRYKPSPFIAELSPEYWDMRSGG